MKGNLPGWISTAIVVLSFTGGMAQAVAAPNFVESQNHGGFDSVALGFDVPTPMGTAYDTLSRSVGIDASFEYNMAGWSANDRLEGSVFYNSYGVTDVVGLSANTNVIGFFAAFRTQGTGGIFGVSPFISLGIGGVYDWLTFSANNSAGVSNNSVAFATRVTPGVEIPVWRMLSAEVSFPWMTAFYKNTFVTWSGDFSVRWKL